MTAITWIEPKAPAESLPPPGAALREPNGLLAAGGDLSPDRLMAAYRNGIFPWYNPGEPILWWSPDPRAVLFPETVHVSRSLKRRLNRGDLRVSADEDFSAVIEACAAPREGQHGTWLTPEMRDAYTRLHRMNLAHSIEVRRDGALIGGVYGVSLGGAFFGESMFSLEREGSKVALVILCRQLQRWGYGLVDCQVQSAHLSRMGAVELPREVFLGHLRDAIARRGRSGSWQLDDDLARARIGHRHEP